MENMLMKPQYKYSTAIAGICFISMTSLANLVAHLPLNNNANDVTGNGHNGVVFGASLTTDRFGNSNSAYRFNGSSDYIDLGTLGGFKTVSLWVKQDFRSGYEFYFGHNDFDLFASVAENGILTLLDNPHGWFRGSEQMDSHIGEWNHIVAISDGASSKLYFNGANITSARSGTLEPVSDAIVNLGRRPDNTYHFNGAIDDVRVYDNILTESEIEALYAIPEPGTLSLIGLCSIVGWFMRRRFNN